MKNQNVIDFANAKQKFDKKSITDSEINSLFLGLLKIIKKSAIESANIDLKCECNQAKQNFADTLKELHVMQIDFNRQKKLITSLENKIEIQKKQICYLVNLLESLKIKSCQIK